MTTAINQADKAYHAHSQILRGDYDSPEALRSLLETCALAAFWATIEIPRRIDRNRLMLLEQACTGALEAALNREN